MSRVRVSYGDRKIKCLQLLAWWLVYLTLQGKIIDLNSFKTDIIDDAITKSRVYFKDTRGGKEELSKAKELSHKKWT